MTTIKDLKKWLDNFPEETIIEFGIQQRAGNYESYGDVKFISPKLEVSETGEGWEFIDFTENKYVKENDAHFGKMYLRLGESC